MYLSSILPVRVTFDDCFVCLARVAIVTNGVVRGGACASKVLHRELPLIRKLHVGGAFDQASQSTRLVFQVLLNRVLVNVKDQDVLLKVALVRCLNSYDDEEAEFFPEHILLACGAEVLSTEMLEKRVDVSRAYGDAHMS